MRTRRKIKTRKPSEKFKSPGELDITPFRKKNRIHAESDENRMPKNPRKSIMFESISPCSGMDRERRGKFIHMQELKLILSDSVIIYDWMMCTRLEWLCWEGFPTNLRKSQPEDD